MLADRRTGAAHFAFQHIERRRIGHVARPEEIGQIARTRRREFRASTLVRDRDREIVVIARNFRSVQLFVHSEKLKHLQTDQLLAVPCAGKRCIRKQSLDRDGYTRGLSGDEASALLIHAELQRRGIGKVRIGPRKQRQRRRVAVFRNDERGGFILHQEVLAQLGRRARKDLERQFEILRRLEVLVAHGQRNIQRLLQFCRRRREAVNINARLDQIYRRGSNPSNHISRTGCKGECQGLGLLVSLFGRYGDGRFGLAGFEQETLRGKLVIGRCGRTADRESDVQIRRRSLRRHQLDLDRFVVQRIGRCSKLHIGSRARSGFVVTAARSQRQRCQERHGQIEILFHNPSLFSET